MPTSVVVATVVNTSMSEADFRQHMVEQLRSNDRSLLDKLADADGNANVITAVLNVEEFLVHLLRRFPKTADMAGTASDSSERAALAECMETKVVTDEMSEGEFMDYMLKQVESGKIEPMLRLSDEAWQAIEDESIGEDFSRYPFMY